MRVYLTGLCVSDMNSWIYEWMEIAHYSPKKIRDALEKNPDGEELEIYINSPGGDVSAGTEIYSLLRYSNVYSTSYIMGDCCSAASVVSCGTTKTLISAVGQLMIHLPVCTAKGSAGQLRHVADMLDSYAESAYNAYIIKTGLSRNEIASLVADETFMTAQKAISLGFVDGYIDSDDAEKLEDFSSPASGATHSSGASGVNNYMEENPIDENGETQPEDKENPEDDEQPEDKDPEGDLANEFSIRSKKLDLYKKIAACGRI